MKTQLLVATIVFSLLLSGVTSQKIIELVGKTYTNSITYGAGTNFVTITDCTFNGQVFLTFDIASMARTDMPIVVELCNVRFLNGAAVLFVGGTDAQMGPTKKPLYVNLNEVRMSDGGLAFANTLPMYSRIVMQKSQGMVNRAGTCTFNGLPGSGRPTTILFSNLHLVQSVLRITTTLIGGAVVNGQFPVYFYAMHVDQYSSWSLDHSNFTKSFAFHGHDLVIDTNSLFLISYMNGACDRFCISWEAGLTVRNGGSYITEYSTASADGHDLLYVSGAMTASQKGLILFKGNYFVTPRYAFSVSSGTIASANGVISFADNSLLGAPWHTTATASGGGAVIVQCNNLGGAALTDANQYLTAGLRGSINVYRCDRRTNCPFPNATCHPGFTDMTALGRTPDIGCCKCLAGGTGDYCLPKVPTFVPPMCSATLTQPLSQTFTLTKSLVDPSPTQTIQRDGLNQSESLLTTVTVSLSVSNNTSATPSFNDTFTVKAVTETIPETRSKLDPSHSHSGNISTTTTHSVSIQTNTMVATETINVSGTYTGSVTTSLELTDTKELTVTRETNTLPDSVTHKITESTTISTTHNLTRSTSTSFTASSCDWIRGPMSDHEGVYNYYPMQLFTAPPLVIRNLDNFTMQITYKNAFSGYNFTLASLGQWEIHRVEFEGESKYVNFRNLTKAKIISGVIYVGPPKEPYSSVLTRFVTIAVIFRCSTHEHTEYFTILILPETAVVSSDTMETVLSIGMAIGMLSMSPPVAAAAAWAMVFQQVMMCRGLDENSAISFTGLSIGDDDRKWLRGAILGNLLIILGQAVLVMLLAVLVTVIARSRDPKSKFVRVIGVLQWPNVMHITVGALLQLSVTGATSLAATNGSVQDYVLSIFALGFFLFYTIRICYALYKAHQDARGSNRRWQVAQSLGAESFVFGNYKLAWFAGYETVNAYIIGVIAGFPPNQTICIIQIWAVFIASLIILCVVAYFRPMKTLLGQIFTCAIHLLTFSAANAMLVAHYVPEQQNSAFNAATILLLMMPIAALLKAITDFVAFVQTGRGMWARLWEDDKDNFEWEYDDGEDDNDGELGEELMNVNDEEKDLEAFLAAVDVAPDVAEKQLKKGKKNPAADNNNNDSSAANPEEKPMNEDELFSMLKI